MDANAWSIVIAIPVIALVMLAHDHATRPFNAFRHARPAIAYLPANALSIGGMREREPQRGRRHANQKLAHR
jgi:hypothetical protein